MKTDKLCSWCEHPHSKHAAKDAHDWSAITYGCLVEVSVGIHCQCSAERGRVRRVKRTKAQGRKG